MEQYKTRKVEKQKTGKPEVEDIVAKEFSKNSHFETFDDENLVDNSTVTDTAQNNEVKDEGNKNGLLYRLNAFIESGVSGWKDFFLHSTAGKIAIMIILFLLVTIPTLLMVLGFDNYFFRSTVKGVVVTKDNELVNDAQITIQGKTATSDKEGFYVLDDLDYGKWEVIIKANGYVEYKEELVIERFVNNKNFELVPLDFGVVTGKFVSVDDFIHEGAEIFINDQKINLNKDGSFDSGKLITGDYKLKVTSLNYKDLEQDIKVKSGNHKLDDIKLDRAGDLEGLVVDFLDQKNLENVEIKVNDTDESIEYKKDEGFIVKDLDVNVEAKLVLKKENYKDKEIKVTVKQGENNLAKISMARNGRIVNYFEGSIVESDYDGENVVNLTGNFTNPRFIKQSEDLIYFTSNSNLYSSNKSGAISIVYSGLEPMGGLIIGKGLISIGSSEGKNFLKFITGEGTTTIFESETESVISWVVDNNNTNLYFSTNAGVYKSNLNESNPAEKITNGIFHLRAINPSNNLLLAVNYASPAGGSGNLWTIETNGTRKKITVYADIYTRIRFINDSTLLFIKEVGGVKYLYTRPVNNFSETKLVTNISDYIYNEDRSLIGVSSTNKYYVVNLSGEAAAINYKK